MALNLKNLLNRMAKDELIAASKQQQSRESDEAAYKSLLTAAALKGDVDDVSGNEEADALVPVIARLGYDSPRVAADLGVLSKAVALLAVADSVPALERQAKEAGEQLEAHHLEHAMSRARVQISLDAKARTGRLSADDLSRAENELSRLSRESDRNGRSIADAEHRARYQLRAAKRARGEFESLAAINAIVDESLLRPTSK